MLPIVEKVISNDNEMTQSDGKPHSKNRNWENKLTILY